MKREAGWLQVPQELASLTALTRLDLDWNAGRAEAPVGVQSDGVVLMPKMRVTEQGCRFLLHFSVLAAVHLMVTEEEEAALAGLLTDLREGRDGPCPVCFKRSQEFILEQDFSREANWLVD